MNATVIGCGRWGSFIAWYLDSLNFNVMLYGREESEHFFRIRVNNGNGMVNFGPNVRYTDDLDEALAFSDWIFISVGAQDFRELMDGMSARETKGKVLVLCMKGLEKGTGLRLSQIAGQYAPKATPAVWLGPGHVQEFVKGNPNCMVIDSAESAVKKELAAALSGKLIRMYYGDDLIGNEVGAAAKNVIGIAAGMLDGIGGDSMKGALMARGAREVSRLIKAMGGNEMTAYGLCHLGDYEATLFSPHSHNRSFGEAFARAQAQGSGTELDMLRKGRHNIGLAEGVNTAQAIMLLSCEYNVDMPICSGVYSVIFHGVEVGEALEGMLLRNLKTEFY